MMVVGQLHINAILQHVLFGICDSNNEENNHTFTNLGID